MAQINLATLYQYVKGSIICEKERLLLMRFGAYLVNNQ